MTPLLGTKNPSATVGDKSGGDRRAARAAAFQVFTKHETRDPRHESRPLLWRGMGRLWRGMGGMGRPEPLSAHRPRRQQRLSGFHETRDPRPGYCQARRVSQREFRGFHETRITAFWFFPVPPATPRRATQARPTGFSRDTNHESRPLCFPTHYFPRFPGISRPPPPPDQMPRRRPPQLSSPSGLPPQR